MIVIAAGQQVGDRYELDRRIAVGGMGEVWEASDTRLGRSVAVKILRPELSGDPEFLHRFRIEARTVASLDHHGIAAVHDYGEADGPSGRATAYLVMELVRGEPLSTHIGKGPIDPDETLRLLEEAARALQAAHERGFVHRDVKPGNILVRTDGKVKLTDFGIAKAADAVPVTRSGMVMGTAHYIAPEQASGAEAGPAGDVYSLGIVGYECLCGQRPFRAENAVAVAMMQVREQPPPLPESIPQRIRDLIEATLVKDPTLRYGTGGEFADAVAAVRRGEPMPVPLSVLAQQAQQAKQNRRPESPKQTSAPTGPPAPGKVQPPATLVDVEPPRKPSVQAPPRVSVTKAAPASDSAADHHDRQADRSERLDPPRPAQPVPAAVVPLHLAPVPRNGRTALLVLFVLIALAALVVGGLMLGGEVPISGKALLSFGARGSVAGWEDIVTGWAAQVRSWPPLDAGGFSR